MRGIGMPHGEARRRRRFAMSLQAALLAAALIMFLLLHFLADAVVQRAVATDGSSSGPDSTRQRYD